MKRLLKGPWLWIVVAVIGVLLALQYLTPSDGHDEITTSRLQEYIAAGEVKEITFIDGDQLIEATLDDSVNREGGNKVQAHYILGQQEGILEQGVYIYMNRGWITKHPAQAEAFMRALVEATDLINKDRKRAAKDVSAFLKSLDPALVEQLMTKLQFEMVLSDFTIDLFRLAESQLKQQGKLTKPLDYGAFVYPDLLRKVAPGKVNYKP